MTARWQFNPAHPSNVRQEVTQRDQFNNDDVSLPEALVREVIQNSLDARIENGPVKVSFNLKSLNNNEAERLALNLQSLEPHLRACGLELPGNSDGSIRVLCVEDFNTSGLTGSYDKLDEENFDQFWRSVGGSEKFGTKGGRWGLGKLVYSSASKINTLFGLTLRTGDDVPSVMGQAVLRNHSIGTKYYPAHGFWFDQRSNGLGLQLPVTDEDEVQEFRKLFGINRKHQTGLSVVIPHLVDGITEESILLGVIGHYYFPILAGRLEVEVGQTTVNADTFLDIAGRFEENRLGIPFSFVKEISKTLASTDPAISAAAPFSAAAPLGRKRFGSEHLTEEQIAAMKGAFASGALVHLRVPVALQPKRGDRRVGHIDLFLKALAEHESSFSLVARGPIVLPMERRFARLPARGALIARDDEAATFLGDAENPAHTGWNASAGKLTGDWTGARDVLTAIRYSLADLHSLIADQEERRDEDALIDFFALADTTEKGEPTRRKRRKKKPSGDRPEPAIRLEEEEGGFALVPGPGATKWKLPRRIRVRMAYDMIGGDPFKRFSRFDFDLNNDKRLTFGSTGGDIRIIGPNRMYFDVTESDFRLEVNGFDTRRDLIVDWRAP